MSHKMRLTDMDDPSEMRQDAIAQATLAAQKHESEKEIAKHVKNFFDAKYSPNWHCIVGKNFATYATYESKTYIFFEVPPLFVLLYKLG
eukprot:CAMPEP_0204273810 /NCGR_PEP_ID=MMETSP0468-20130131/24376_1 /ASSEMBLY_ACC=CAM_ASM_000383 /TAXON_ID=2969 /ORGANISM="Oxyrrhis marina" /LENGTH=88 /DNA_ID=CAMNT_0051249921 /DNA_START=64 /DNA_END=330 /DNA_ORIENTATION=-